MALSPEALLERERQRKRIMEESFRALLVAFQEKMRERTMLMRQKQDMVAEEAANQKLVADFMVFIDNNNNPEMAHKVDENAMMSDILSAMKTNGDNVPKIIQEIEEQAKVDAVLATINCDANYGSDKGETSNASKNTMNVGEEPKKDGNKETNNDGSEGGDAGRCGGSC